MAKRPIFVGLLVAAILVGAQAQAQQSLVTSFDQTGRVAWTCASLNVSNRLEWVASPEALASDTWPHQQFFYVQYPSNEASVAMDNAFACYRVVCELPDPHFPDISTAQSLALLAHRDGDPGFAVVDVRTAGEFASLHIIGAINIDFYSSTFEAQLDALDKEKAYIVHCASGYRSGITSGNAHDTMYSLGFREVYNMLGGMNSFRNLPGADAYLEP